MFKRLMRILDRLDKLNLNSLHSHHIEFYSDGSGHLKFDGSVKASWGEIENAPKRIREYEKTLLVLRRNK